MRKMGTDICHLGVHLLALLCFGNSFVKLSVVVAKVSVYRGEGNHLYFYIYLSGCRNPYCSHGQVDFCFRI